MKKVMPKVGQEVEFRIMPEDEYERGIVIEVYSAQFMVRQWDEWERMVLLTGDWRYAPSK